MSLGLEMSRSIASPANSVASPFSNALAKQHETSQLELNILQGVTVMKSQKNI